MVRFFYEHHRLICRSGGGGDGVPHAWSLQLRWDDELEEWVFKVAVPGFVRGHDVEVTTSAFLAGDEARIAAGLQGEPTVTETQRLKVPLTSFPEVAIPSSSWRKVVSVETVILQDSPARSVPPILQENYNILIPDNLRIDTENFRIDVINEEEQIEQDLDSASLLYSVELYLKMPRPTVAPVQSVSEAGIEYIDLQIEYARPTDDPPYLDILTSPPLETEAVMNTTVAMALGGGDVGYDMKHIATIWLVGPPGELYEDKVTADWTPVIQYHTFYSLDYTVEASLRRVPPLRQRNPAAGLLSGVAVQALVEIINEYNRQVEAIYQQVTINGRFWTV